MEKRETVFCRKRCETKDRSTPPARPEPTASLPAPSPAPAASTDVVPATATPLDDTIPFANAANCEAWKETEALFNNILTPPQGDIANINAVRQHPMGTDSGGQSPWQPTICYSGGCRPGSAVHEQYCERQLPAKAATRSCSTDQALDYVVAFLRKTMLIRKPPSFDVPNATCALMASASACTMARPRPAPPAFGLREGSSR